MSIEYIKNALPEYAKDLKLNLSSLTRTTQLNERQLWGCLVAAAAASGNDNILSAIMEEAKTHLSDTTLDAALAAASIMAMNNVAYRARSWLGQEYGQVKMGLRMNVMVRHGVDNLDFNLWCLVVSAVNGCEHCTVAHDKEVREAGLTREQTWEAIKIAATIFGIAQTMGVAPPNS